MRRKQAIQAYPDGMVRIYGVTNTAEPGRKPVKGLALKAKLPYAQKTVGAMRYTQGILVNYRIDNRLRVPKGVSVTTEDVAITQDDVRYVIRQVQYPEEVTPPSMDLALERMASTDDLIGLSSMADGH